MRPALILALALALAACNEDEEKPNPLVMNDEALGHYCQMYLADHAGPKAQVFVAGYAQPFWFSQVSDAVAYRDDPEKPAPITVTYVSDMDKAESWSVPGTANWVEAEKAHYVIDSDQTGGMGLPEAVPFGTAEGAEAFAASHGGKVVAWADIPAEYNRTGLEDGGPIAAPETAPHTPQTPQTGVTQ